MVKTNKHKLRFKSKLYNFIILTIMIIYLVVIGIFLYQKEYGKDTFLRHKLDSLDLTYLYNLHISKTPNIDLLPSYGSPNASVTLIAYLDINSESSKFFINEIFPKLNEEFINTGKLRYYQKNYITEEDYRKKTNRFIYAKSLFCILEIDKDVYYDFYFDIIKKNHGIGFYAKKYNISNELLTDCMVNQEYDVLMEDILEVKRFGILGIKQKFYIGIEGKDNKIVDGVPSYTRFQRLIKQHLFNIGGLI